MIEELAQDDVKVALIITDLLMPGTNGDEFLVEVKQQYPDICAILITWHADRAAVERTMRETAVRVFQKPWRAAELLQAVSDCLEGPGGPEWLANPGRAGRATQPRQAVRAGPGRPSEQE
ncbi:MAG: response regulator [Spirochaeta sp.]|nr:response regulator [Spirochaeta sp.]